MSDKNLYKPSDRARNNSLINENEFREKYKFSLDKNEDFWSEEAKRIQWMKPFTKVKDVSYELSDLHIKWFYDGSLNASSNCIDRHLDKKGEEIAIIWEGDNPNESKKITYRELYSEVCKFANALKNNGAKKGDRITIYMPMIPEAAVAMLACARIGAVHSVVFGGFHQILLLGGLLIVILT